MVYRREEVECAYFQGFAEGFKKDKRNLCGDCKNKGTYCYKCSRNYKDFYKSDNGVLEVE